MPPDMQRDGTPARKHRPSKQLASRATAAVAMVRQETPLAAGDDARQRYGNAVELCRTALAERARAAAEVGLSAGAAEDYLALLRRQLHAEVDLIVDREVRRRATARRLAAVLASGRRT